MPFQSCPDCAQVQMTFVLDGQRVQNVLNFRHTGGAYNEAQISALAIMVADWWESHYNLYVSSALGLIEVLARGLENADDYETAVTSFSPSIGAVSGACLPNNVAYCLSLLTGFSGRSHRGRVYIPGIPVSRTVASHMDPSYSTGYVAAFAALPALANDIGWVWGVLSRVTGGLPRSVGLVFEIENVVARDYTLDSQRRRLPGRGL